MPITISISKEGIAVAALYIIFYNPRNCEKAIKSVECFESIQTTLKPFNCIALDWSPLQLWICFMWYLCTSSIKSTFLQSLAHFHSLLHQMIWANVVILISQQRFWILVEWCQWLFPQAYKTTGRTIASFLSSENMKEQMWVWKWVWQCQPILWW